MDESQKQSNATFRNTKTKPENKMKNSLKPGIKNVTLKKQKKRRRVSTIPVLRKTKKNTKYYNSFRRSLFQLIRKNHENTSVTQLGMNVLNSMLLHFFDKIATEVRILNNIHGKKTITTREIETSVKLVIPRELQPIVITYSKKSIQNYIQNNIQK